MTEKSTTLISLPQMVDLALNSPEVGIVNFTVLHSLLHVIVNQLDLGDCNVEFRGSDSDRLQSYIATAKPGPIITLTEYTVGPDGKNRKKKNKKKKNAEEKGKKDENQKEKEIAIIKKNGEASMASVTSGSMQTIVVVEPASKDKIDESPKFTIAITKEHLSKLQKDIKDLQREVKELTELPGNMGLIDAIRTSKEGPCSPVLDMFQILTLTKRLDASELAMNKVASMIEDLAKGRSSLTPKERRLSFKDAADDLLTKSQELRRSLDNTVGGDHQMHEIFSEIKELANRITQLERGEGGKRSQHSSKTDGGTQPTQRSTKSTNRNDDDDDIAQSADDMFNTLDIASVAPQEALLALQEEIIKIKENDTGLTALRLLEEMKETFMSENKNLPPDVKVGQIEIKVNQFGEQLATMDTVYHQQFSNIADRFVNLEQEIAALWERINSGEPIGEQRGGGGVSQIQELCNKLIQLQSDLNELSETASKLWAEREGRQDSIDVMIEQIELLKTVKADKEDLEDALADKADACQVNRKVSHDQFDAAYNDLSRSFESTLEKLRQQEDLWVQSLNDIQQEIGNKLDKLELAPLKDFINAKLKGIQEKVKQISSMRQDHEAAGTKSKLLRNVNCISCDADVVMKRQTDITMFPKPYAVSPSKSPAPYLAYELDALRQQKKALNAGKNLNLLENAMQTGKMRSDKDHLCNRYCGGGHTVTTPEQRVMRVGHFMEQWGPEIAPVNEVMIKGTDGHLYKGRDDAALRAAALEKSPTPRIETAPLIDLSTYSVANNRQTLSNTTNIQSGNGGAQSRQTIPKNEASNGAEHGTSPLPENRAEVASSDRQSTAVMITNDETERSLNEYATSAEPLNRRSSSNRMETRMSRKSVDAQTRKSVGLVRPSTSVPENGKILENKQSIMNMGESPN